MTVILFLLKLIGIILLILLGLVILLLLLLLFVPVRYRADGSFFDENSAHVRLHWLLHIVSILASYEEKELKIELRIFGFCLYPRREKTSASDDTDSDDIQEDSPPEQKIKTSSVKQDAAEDKEAEKTEAYELTDPFKAKESETDKSGEESRAGAQTKESETDKSEESSKTSAHIKQTVQGAVWKGKRILKAFQKIPDKALTAKRIVSDEGNQKALSLLWKQLCYLLRHSRFRKIKTDLTFSMGDPAVAGQTLGIICMFPMLYQYEISLIPDFQAEQMYVRGTFALKGHIRLVHGVCVFIQLWNEKDFRRFVKRIMKNTER